MENRAGGFHGSVGITSILIIFVVLCLTTFGVLSYSSAHADERLTKKNVDHVMAYYQADGLAQKKLVELDALLCEVRTISLDESSYKEELFSALADRTDISVKKEKEFIISYEIPVTETQYLWVELEVQPLEKQERYVILRYQLMTGDIWSEQSSEDEQTGLWQGSQIEQNP